jgi:hypothetical protein
MILFLIISLIDEIWVNNPTQQQLQIYSIAATGSDCYNSRFIFGDPAPDAIVSDNLMIFYSPRRPSVLWNLEHSRCGLLVRDKSGNEPSAKG